MIYEELLELIQIAKKEVNEKCINYLNQHPEAINNRIDIATRFDIETESDMKAAMIAVFSTGFYDYANKEFNFAKDEECMKYYLEAYKGMQDDISYWMPVKNAGSVKQIPIIYKYRDILEGRL